MMSLRRVAIVTVVVTFICTDLSSSGTTAHDDATDEEAVDLSRRSVFQFGRMIACLQGISETEAGLKYLEYGCWCGKGGGGQTVDKIDQCCYDHDKCYESMHDDCTPDELVYAVDYKYSRKNCKESNAYITCGDSSEYSWLEKLGNLHKCGKGTCECDRIAAECFAQNDDVYKSSNLYTC